jgi:predicted DNA-binding mobile mystery protein A
MNAHRLNARRKLDERLAGLGYLVGPRPVPGWVRTLRDALGMSVAQLAVRMNVSPSRVSQIERAEEAGALHLSTLGRAAQALNCRLVYALVPDEPLEDMVMRQAFLKASEELGLSDADGPEENIWDSEKFEQREVLTLDWVDRWGLWG